MRFIGAGDVTGAVRELHCVELDGDAIIEGDGAADL